MLTSAVMFGIICKSVLRQAGMAQSVAHLIGSEEVTGSIPVASLKGTSRGRGPFFISETIYKSLIKEQKWGRSVEGEA